MKATRLLQRRADYLKRQLDAGATGSIAYAELQALQCALGYMAVAVKAAEEAPRIATGIENAHKLPLRPEAVDA